MHQCIQVNIPYIRPGKNPNNVNNIQIKKLLLQPLCNNTPNGGNTIARINSKIPLQSHTNAIQYNICCVVLECCKLCIVDYVSYIQGIV